MMGLIFLLFRLLLFLQTLPLRTNNKVNLRCFGASPKQLPPFLPVNCLQNEEFAPLFPLRFRVLRSTKSHKEEGEGEEEEEEEEEEEKEEKRRQKTKKKQKEQESEGKNRKPRSVPNKGDWVVAAQRTIPATRLFPCLRHGKKTKQKILKKMMTPISQVTKKKNYLGGERSHQNQDRTRAFDRSPTHPNATNKPNRKKALVFPEVKVRKKEKEKTERCTDWRHAPPLVCCEFLHVRCRCRTQKRSETPFVCLVRLGAISFCPPSVCDSFFFPFLPFETFFSSSSFCLSDEKQVPRLPFHRVDTFNQAEAKRQMDQALRKMKKREKELNSYIGIGTGGDAHTVLSNAQQAYLAHGRALASLEMSSQLGIDIDISLLDQDATLPSHCTTRSITQKTKKRRKGGAGVDKSPLYLKVVPHASPNESKKGVHLEQLNGWTHTGLFVETQFLSARELDAHQERVLKELKGIDPTTHVLLSGPFGSGKQEIFDKWTDWYESLVEASPCAARNLSVQVHPQSHKPISVNVVETPVTLRVDLNQVETCRMTVLLICILRVVFRSWDVLHVARESKFRSLLQILESPEDFLNHRVPDAGGPHHPSERNSVFYKKMEIFTERLVCVESNHGMGHPFVRRWFEQGGPVSQRGTGSTSGISPHRASGENQREEPYPLFHAFVNSMERRRRGLLGDLCSEMEDEEDEEGNEDREGRKENPRTNSRSTNRSPFSELPPSSHSVLQVTDLLHVFVKGIERSQLSSHEVSQLQRILHACQKWNVRLVLSTSTPNVGDNHESYLPRVMTLVVSSPPVDTLLVEQVVRSGAEKTSYASSSHPSTTDSGSPSGMREKLDQKRCLRIWPPLPGVLREMSKHYSFRNAMQTTLDLATEFPEWMQELQEKYISSYENMWHRMDKIVQSVCSMERSKQLDVLSGRFVAFSESQKAFFHRTVGGKWTNWELLGTSATDSALGGGERKEPFSFFSSSRTDLSPVFDRDASHEQSVPTKSKPPSLRTRNHRKQQKESAGGLSHADPPSSDSLPPNACRPSGQRPPETCIFSSKIPLLPCLRDGLLRICVPSLPRPWKDQIFSPSLEDVNSEQPWNEDKEPKEEQIRDLAKDNEDWDREDEEGEEEEDREEEDREEEEGEEEEGEEEGEEGERERDTLSQTEHPDDPFHPSRNTGRHSEPGRAVPKKKEWNPFSYVPEWKQKGGVRRKKKAGYTEVTSRGISEGVFLEILREISQTKSHHRSHIIWTSLRHEVANEMAQSYLAFLSRINKAWETKHPTGADPFLTTVPPPSASGCLPSVGEQERSQKRKRGRPCKSSSTRVAPKDVAAPGGRSPPSDNRTSSENWGPPSVTRGGPNPKSGLFSEKGQNCCTPPLLPDHNTMDAIFQDTMSRHHFPMDGRGLDMAASFLYIQAVWDLSLLSKFLLLFPCFTDKELFLEFRLFFQRVMLNFRNNAHLHQLMPSILTHVFHEIFPGEVPSRGFCMGLLYFSEIVKDWSKYNQFQSFLEAASASFSSFFELDQQEVVMRHF